jgi:hypothetical protein
LVVTLRENGTGRRCNKIVTSGFDVNSVEAGENAPFSRDKEFPWTIANR